MENIADFDFNENDNARLGDMGCAAGVLPNFIKSNFENIDVVFIELPEDVFAGWLRIDSNTGVITIDPEGFPKSGLPDKLQTYSWFVRVTDEDGTFVEKEFPGTIDL